MLKLSYSEVKFLEVSNFLYNKHSGISEVTYLIGFLLVSTVYTLNKTKKCLFDGLNQSFEGNCTRLELYYLTFL